MKPSKDLDEQINNIVKRTVAESIQITSQFNELPDESYSNYLKTIKSEAKQQLLSIIEQREREARIDELMQWKGSVHENTGSRGGSAIRAFNTAVRYFKENLHERIAELKQELNDEA